jgi:flagellar biosynthesis protein FlhG
MNSTRTTPGAAWNQQSDYPRRTTSRFAPGRDADSTRQEASILDSIHFDAAAPASFAEGRSRRTLAKPRRAASVFAVSSGKGGVGKTSVVANLAVALSQRGKRILTIDADLGTANLDLFLGIKGEYSLADFFAGSAALDDIILTNRDGILVMPGASGIQEITTLSNQQKALFLTELDHLAHAMDLVLVDTGSGISDAVTYFTSAAQEIILVATPEPSSLTDAYALIKVLHAAQRQQRFLVLANNVSDGAEARCLFDTLSRTALRFLNVSLEFLDWIPRDPQLLSATARARTVISTDAGAPSARAFAGLADKLLQRCRADARVKGNLQFFFRRILESGKAEQ